jgi:hypothetical protein
MKNYTQVYDGEPMTVPSLKTLLSTPWNIACCDCGLVHTLKFEYIIPAGKKRKRLAVTINVNRGRTRTLRKNKAHICRLVVK